MRGKTIQVYLTDGSPRGIKLAEITSNIELAVFIPRNKMIEAASREEVTRPGVYFLFGENEQTSKPVVYIGQSRNCLDRIKTHDQKKDFWNYAILIVSKTKSFTQTHVEYLEQMAVSMAQEANRYEMENGASPRKFSIPESLESDLLNSFETIKVLLSTLGFPLFETFVKTEKAKDKFYCKGKGAAAEGEFVEDGMLVYKGSTFAKEFPPSVGSSVTILRQKLLNDSVFTDKGDVFELIENYLFKSPSSSAAQILGRNSNGWVEWKDKNGKTMDELLRK